MNKGFFLRRNDIHVWSADLDCTPAEGESFRKILSPDEKERADNFYFEKDRLFFTSARAILRILLGGYENTQPESIPLTYNNYGKPLMKSSVKSRPLHFNLSHTENKALFAFSRRCPIGIDLERIRVNLDYMSLAKRFFSGAEFSQLFSLPGIQQAEAFFTCWTRKEAFMKAKEIGLSLDLAKFEVSLKPGEPAQLIRTLYKQQDAQQWTLVDIDAGTGYKAALAARSGPIHVIYFRYDSSSL